MATVVTNYKGRNKPISVANENSTRRDDIEKKHAQEKLSR